MIVKVHQAGTYISPVSFDEGTRSVSTHYWDKTGVLNSLGLYPFIHLSTEI